MSASDAIHLMDRRKETGEECFVYVQPKTLYFVTWSKNGTAQPRQCVAFQIRKSKLRKLLVTR